MKSSGIRKLTGSILLIVCLVWPVITSGAQSDTLRFLTMRPGYSWMQGRDVGMSPLLYSGGHFHGQIGLEKTKNRCYKVLQLDLTFGEMTTTSLPKGRRSRALSGRVQMNYAQQYNLKSWKDGRLQWFLGGSWMNFLTLRFHQRYLNNSLNYEFSSAIGPSSSLRYKTELFGKPYECFVRMDIPLLAFNLRPSFASSIPEGYIAQERSDVRAFFDSGRLQTLNRFFRVRNELGIARVLNNKNRLVISYVWDFYHISHIHPVDVAQHQILIGWYFSF